MGRVTAFSLGDHFTRFVERRAIAIESHRKPYTLLAGELTQVTSLACMPTLRV